MRKLLAALLSLVLLLGLTVPVMAEEDRYNLYIPWDDVTVSYPQASFDNHYMVAYGESFTLAIEATLPDDVEISYQWWYSPEGKGLEMIEGETGSCFSSSPGDIHYPNPMTSEVFIADKPFSPQFGYYECTITLERKDTNGVVIDTYDAETNTIVVEVEAEREMTLWERVWYNGIVRGFGLVVAFGIISGGLGFLVAPILYPFAVIITFFNL